MSTPNIPLLFSHLTSPVLADRKAAMESISIVPNVGDYLQSADVATLVTFYASNSDDEDCSRVCLETLLSISADTLGTCADALVPSLLETLRGNFFWCRMYALQLLTKLHESTSGVVQRVILLHPHAIGAIVDILRDGSYDGVIRNEALVLLTQLTSTHEEICKIFAFQEGFEVLTWIVVTELGGLAGAGILACDCLNIMMNMLRGNKATQLYYIETGCVQGLAAMLGGEGLDVPSEHMANGVSIILAIISLLTRENGDAIRKAAVQTQLLGTLLDLTVSRGDTRVCIEAMRCLGGLVQGLHSNNTAVVSQLLNHRAFTSLFNFAVQSSADSLLRHAAMGVLHDLISRNPEVQTALCSSNQFLQTLTAHIVHTVQQQAYDPYSAIIFCDIIHNNKETRAAAASQARVAPNAPNGSFYEWLLQYVLHFFSSDVSSTQHPPQAVLHCKVLYRVLLTWLDDCPATCSGVKRDVVRTCIVQTLSDPLGATAAMEPVSAWYYGFGVLLVLQLYTVTRDSQWKTTVYHDITVPVASSTFAALSEYPEWATAPESCVASLGTAPYDAAFCSRMKTLHETVLTEIVESFLHGHDGASPTTSNSQHQNGGNGDDGLQQHSVVSLSESVAAVRRAASELQELRLDIERGEADVRKALNSDPAHNSDDLNTATPKELEQLRSEVAEQQDEIEALRQAIATLSEDHRAATGGITDQDMEILRSQIAGLDRELSWSASELSSVEATHNEISREIQNVAVGLVKAQGQDTVSELVRSGSLPRMAVPRKLLVEAEFRDACGVMAGLKDDVAAQADTRDDVMLLLSEIDEHVQTANQEECDER
eukprot:PhM_4_TR6741/c0_g1_i1/m.16053